MIVRRTIAELHNKFRLDIVENLEFSELDTGSFQEIFYGLKKMDLILSDSFEAPVWNFPCEVKRKSFVLKFDLEIYKNINLALKGYILLRRASGTSPQTCYNELNILRTLVRKSFGFNNRENIQAYLDMESPQVAWKKSTTLRKFIEFYRFPNCNDLLDLCNNYKKEDYGNRTLPDFDDVLRFDEIIEDFFNSNYEKEQRIPYLPVLLWWKITNVLPIRPNEFLRINNDD